VAQLGANALGEVLEPAGCRTATSACASTPTAPKRPVYWWSPPPRCCTRSCRSRAAPSLYELVTGHPAARPASLVLLAELTVELRAKPADT
jgi:hypothetical protein